MFKTRQGRVRSGQCIIPNNNDDIEQEKTQRNLEGAFLNEHGTKSPGNPN